MQNFKKINAWQKAHSLALAVNTVTESFPRDEQYGLTSQIRRACISIPTNIAEGCGRDGTADFARCLQISQGSASELEYQLLLARDLKYLNNNDYETLDKQVNEVRRMLNTFSQKLKANN